MIQCHNEDGLSGGGLMTSLGEGKDRSFNKITANWVMTPFAVIVLNDLYLSLLQLSLLRGSQHCGSLIGTLATQR